MEPISRTLHTQTVCTPVPCLLSPTSLLAYRSTHVENMPHRETCTHTLHTVTHTVTCAHSDKHTQHDMHTQWCMHTHIHSASNVPPTTTWKSACCQQPPSNNNVGVFVASNIPPTTMWKSACCQQHPSNNNVEECLLPATSLQQQCGRVLIASNVPLATSLQQQCGRVLVASNVPPTTMWKNAYFFFDNSCSVWGCKRTVNWNRLSILGTAKHIDKNNTVIQRARNIRSFSLTHTHTPWLSSVHVLSPWPCSHHTRRQSFNKATVMVTVELHTALYGPVGRSWWYI